MTLVAILYLLDSVFMGPPVPGKPWVPDLAALVESEKAFSRASVAQGSRDAYLSYLANDAIVFRPLPVAGKKYYDDRPETPGVLSREPSFAEVSIAGDLGYTAGPWRHEAEAGKAQRTGYGDYVSMWRKQSDGSWRVVADLGNTHPRPATSLEGVGFPEHMSSSRRTAQPAPVAIEKGPLIDADRSLARMTVSHGIRQAYDAFATEDIRLYRHNVMPMVGGMAVRSALDRSRASIVVRTMFADLSRSGDLGYTYGLAFVRADDSGAPPDTNSYLRIWRKGRDKRWKLALDFMTPARR